MAWFTVDDQMHGHPKLAEIDPARFAEAISLWTLAGSWCANHLTDGRVPTAQLRKLVPFNPAKAAAELARVGLWDKADGGYVFHDWSHYQASRSEVEQRRAAQTSRTRKSRQLAKERVTSRVTTGATDAVTHASVTAPHTHTLESTKVLSARGVLVRGFQRAWEGVTKSAWTGTRGASEWDEAVKVVEKTAEMRSCEHSALIDAAIAAWLADKWVQENGYPPMHFARNIAKYFGEVKPDPEDVPPLKAAWNAAEARVESARKQGADGMEVARLEKEALAALEAWRAEKSRTEAA
jgi:hypothetical protein